jgi:outer membrane protein TolC
LLHEAHALEQLRCDLESKIRLQVRQAWLSLEETRERLNLTRDVIAHAEENFWISQDRYRVGAGTNTQVLDAESLRAQSYRNHAHACYDAILAAFRVRRAVSDL